MALAVAVLLGACGPGGDAQTGGDSMAGDQQPAPAGPEVAMQSGEFMDLLRSPSGRYSKHGWNHYGPGYFELDPETALNKRV